MNQDEMGKVTAKLAQVFGIEPDRIPKRISAPSNPETPGAGWVVSVALLEGPLGSPQGAMRASALVNQILGGNYTTPCLDPKTDNHDLNNILFYAKPLAANPASLDTLLEHSAEIQMAAGLIHTRAGSASLPGETTSGDIQLGEVQHTPLPADGMLFGPMVERKPPSPQPTPAERSARGPQPRPDIKKT